MDHELSVHVVLPRVVEAPHGAEDPLELHGLWPITTDFTSAMRQVSSTIYFVANMLSQDHNPSTAILRQALLEIRARLIYVISEFGVSVVAATSHLIFMTVHTISTNLSNDPDAEAPADLAGLLPPILDGCADNHRLLNDTLAAWDDFYLSFCEYYIRSRMQHAGGVMSFLRTFGTSSNSLSLISDTSTTFPGSGVHQELLRMLQSLGRIEVFWRKRQNLYAGLGYTFGREQMSHFYKSSSQLSDGYLQFTDPLVDSQFDLSRVEPAIDKSPDSLSEPTKIQMSWRALLA